MRDGQNTQDLSTRCESNFRDDESMRGGVSGTSGGGGRGFRKAVGYLRRSTDRQEQSIPDQMRAIEQYAQRNHFELLRCYTDDAISGTSSVGRKAFQTLIADAQSSSRDFSVIIVYDVKRFGRVGNDEAGYYRYLLRQHGVEIRYASENFSGDGTDDLLRPVKQWQAREESKDLSKVTIRGLLSKSGTGFWMGGASPFGYDLRYESQTGQFLLCLRYLASGMKAVLDDQGNVQRTLERGESIAVSRKDHCRLLPGEAIRVETVQRIFAMYVQEGRGFRAIAGALNREGVPTARGPQWSEHYCGQWAMTTVRAILVNPVYCGDMVWNRRTDARFHRIEDGRAVLRQDVVGRRLENNQRCDWIVVKDAHPALVSRQLWEEAQRRMADKPNSANQRGVNPRTGVSVDGRRRGPVGGWTGPRARFLLSGLCSCVKCNSRYEGYTERSSNKQTNGSRKKWYFYACGAAIRRGPGACRFGLARQDEFENAVMAAVLKHYENYTGTSGSKKLETKAQNAMGDQHRRVEEELSSVRQRSDKVKETIRNLLDNITATNRELVDERIGELTRERESLKARLEELERLALSRSEFKRMIDDAYRFIVGLPDALAHEKLEQRQAAIRCCVQRIVVDHENLRAKIELHALPAVMGRTDGLMASRGETLEIAIGSCQGESVIFMPQ